jgi:hypothetical protein
MAENIYTKIAKLSGKDVRLVRTAAHHPFEFVSNVMADMEDHRPIRLRYLGAFIPKPHWRKGMKSVKKVGYPKEGDNIYARVPVFKFNKYYRGTKKGSIEDGNFISEDGTVKCPVNEVMFWVKSSFSE